MKASDLFDGLTQYDSEMSSARDWVAYNKFQRAVPEILSLSEYVDTIFRNAVLSNDSDKLWFSEKYMVSKYIFLSENATPDYINNMKSKLDSIKKVISSDSRLEYVKKFIAIIYRDLDSWEKLFSKPTLLLLNDIYKYNGYIHAGYRASKK